MKESVWGYFVIVVGIVIIFLIFFFQNITNTDEHNMSLLKSVTESSMNDAIDWGTYQGTGVLKISENVFVESFIRRFAEDAQLASTYKIEFYNIQEEPPLVNIRIYTNTSTNSVGGDFNFKLTNTLNAILETDPNRDGYEIVQTIVPTNDGSDDNYNCELYYSNGGLAIYDKTKKSKVSKAYIDGESVKTTQNLLVDGNQTTVYIKNGVTNGNHTGNLIYEDGHIALCVYPKK